MSDRAEARRPPTLADYRDHPDTTPLPGCPRPAPGAEVPIDYMAFLATTLMADYAFVESDRLEFWGWGTGWVSGEQPRGPLPPYPLERLHGGQGAASWVFAIRGDDPASLARYPDSLISSKSGSRYYYENVHMYPNGGWLEMSSRVGLGGQWVRTRPHRLYGENVPRVLPS